MIKRLFDIVGSVLGLCFVSPLVAVAAIAIKLDSPGPIFFRQERLGRGFQPFMILKLRSMSGEHANASLITVAGDSRVTRIGRLLRMTKIDELPQLFNVLRGEMSLVGPRPEVRKYVEMFRADYEQILKVRPGITDMASIYYRDEEAALAGAADPELEYRRVVLPKKIALAKEYIRRSSFMLDVRLILLTGLRILLGGRGAEGSKIR